MKLSLSLKEECEARMKRSSTRDGSSRKHHLRRRHRSSSSSSSSSPGSRRHRSRSKSSSRSHGSRSHRRPKHSSGRRRSHSRSGSDRSMDRMDRFGRRLNPTNVTNSKDPKAVASRIFLGSLPPDVQRDDVDARFSKYGKILGITLLQGYGFVQFEEEGEAIRAVHTENGTELKGSKIDVRLASEHKKFRSSVHGDDGHRKHSSRDQDYPPRPFPPPPPPRDPYADQYGLPPPPPPHMDPYHRPPHPADPYARGPPLPPPHGDPYHRGPPLPPYHRGPPHPDDPYARGPPFDPYARGPPPPPGDPYRRPPYPEPYPYHGPGSSYGPSAPPPPSLDCEIIVLDEKQRSYADSIKKRLMSAGVVTEMNILPPAIDILVALEEATRRHLLFAIIVNDQNEIHRSITVNILHGLTQEHRNMPVDDAITLVTRSFDKYMLEKQEKMSKEAEDGVAKRAPDFLRPTASTLYMLNLLADNRYLTVDELDTVLDYLQLRRDRLLKGPGGGGGGGGGAAAVARSVGPTTPPPIKKVKVEDVGPPEPDIKSILGLLQKEKTASIEAAKPVSSYNSTSLSSASSALSSTSINFNNAAVQQALDNLINSGPNLLKSLKDVGKTPPAAVASAASRSYSDEGTVDPYEDFERSYAAGQQYRGGAY